MEKKKYVDMNESEKNAYRKKVKKIAWKITKRVFLGIICLAFIALMIISVL